MSVHLSDIEVTKLKKKSSAQCTELSNKYSYFLHGYLQITLAVNSAVTDWHDWMQELWHSGKSVTMTLTALLEEGVCKELTS
jgi:hypothetical protein